MITLVEWLTSEVQSSWQWCASLGFFKTQTWPITRANLGRLHYPQIQCALINNLYPARATNELHALHEHNCQGWRDRLELWCCPGCWSWVRAQSLVQSALFLFSLQITTDLICQVGFCRDKFAIHCKLKYSKLNNQPPTFRPVGTLSMWREEGGSFRGMRGWS